MEKVNFYHRLQTIAEYLILILALALLVYAVGRKLFGLSLTESLGVAFTVMLIRLVYKLMGKMGK